MRLIGVTGLARSGKDHAARYLAKEMGLYQYAFAEPLKTMLKSVFGDHFHEGDRSEICPETGVSYRVMMQQQGTELGRNRWGENVWTYLVARKYREVQTPFAMHKEYRGMVLSDVRFNSEAHWVRDNHGVVLRIVRPGVEQQVVGIEGHPSEQGIRDAFVTHTIVNDGTLHDFDMKLMALVSELMGQ